jgi:hypothetical protein
VERNNAPQATSAEAPACELPLECKPHTDERLPKFLRLKGLKVPRRLAVQE